MIRSAILFSILIFCARYSTAEHLYSFENIERLAKLDLGKALAELSTMQPSDTKKLIDKQYYTALILATQGNVDSALFLFKQNTNALEKTAHSTRYIRHILQIGIIYYDKGKYNRALKYFVSAQRLAIITKEKLLQSQALNYIGKCSHSKGQFDKSAKFYKRALFLANKADDKESVVFSLINIGKYHETIGQYDEALSYYMKAKRLADSTTNRILKGTIYNHLGSIFEILEEYDKSLAYHKRGLAEREKLGFLQGVSKSLKNLGEVYIKIQQYDTAQAYFEQSLDIATQVAYKKGIVKNYMNLGIISNLQGNSDKAQRYFDEQLRLVQEMGYEKGIANAHLQFGHLYTTTKLYAKAEYHLKQALAIAEKNKMLESEKQAYYALYKIASEKQAFADALAYFKLYSATTGKIENEKIARHIAELEIKFGTEKKQQQNDLLTKDNEIKTLSLRKKNLMLILNTIILLLSIVSLISIYSRYRNKQKVNRLLTKLNRTTLQQNKELKKLNKELDAANREKDKFFSIIAHEVRNPLWWFKNLAEMLSISYKSMDEQKLEKVIRSLDDTAKNSFHLMDNLLQWSKMQLGRNAFAPEKINMLPTITDNVNLWKTAASYKNINIQYCVLPSVYAKADKEMLDTVIRNLLSNALKFTNQGGSISIRAYETDRQVTVEVEDTGIGISRERANRIFVSQKQISTLGIMHEKGSGIGLLLCKEFIEKNGGTIAVESQENRGTIFRFNLPAYY